jgi:hypothetical protein
MDFLAVTRILAGVGLAIGILGILLRLKEILDRPFKEDLARPRGSKFRGVLYAFTLGMAPWEKESTRIHWIVYLRGIFFHIGVFAAFVVLFISPWLALLPEIIKNVALFVVGFGALAGYAGIVIRLADPSLRLLSLPDDYFSVFLTSTFVAAAFLALLTSIGLPIFYLVTAFLAVIVPFSKIRHCVYFFYSKFFFGANFGNRGVISRTDRTYTEG